MIDFNNGSLFKLGVCDPSEVMDLVQPMFIGDERILVAM